jgi:hypothetical protein
MKIEEVKIEEREGEERRELDLISLMRKEGSAMSCSLRSYLDHPVALRSAQISRKIARSRV